MIGLKKNTEMIAANQVDYDSLLPLYYNFEFRQIPFECQVIAGENNGSYIVNISAQIGHLPYSCENQTKRKKILNNFNHLMHHKLITMDHHCNMTFPLKTTITGKINAKKVMETILYTLLDVQEVLDIIVNTMQYGALEDRSKMKKA